MGIVQRWMAPAALVLTASSLLADGVSALDVALLVLFLSAAVLLSPLLYPRSVGDERGRALADERDAPLIYVKPGCSYCVRMRLALGPRGRRAVWVDISRDATAAASVRAHNAGDETTPTVVAGGEVRTNPPPAWVRSRLPS